MLSDDKYNGSSFCPNSMVCLLGQIKSDYVFHHRYMSRNCYKYN